MKDIFKSSSNLLIHYQGKLVGELETKTVSNENSVLNPDVEKKFPARKSKFPSSLTKLPSSKAYFPYIFLYFFSQNHKISLQGTSWFAHFSRPA